MNGHLRSSVPAVLEKSRAWSPRKQEGKRRRQDDYHCPAQCGKREESHSDAEFTAAVYVCWETRGAVEVKLSIYLSRVKRRNCIWSCKSF